MTALYEQVSRTGGRLSYLWILEPGERKIRLPGWEWVPGARGMRGCFVTHDFRVACEAAVRLGLVLKSNGTHEAIGAPLFQEMTDD